jgi:hypothetical protein
MALLAYKQIGDGAAITLDAVNSSETIPWDDRGFYEIANASGGSENVTFVVPGTVHGTAVPDLVVAVPNSATRQVKLTYDMVDQSTGLITITHSVTTSVTAAAKRV